MRALIPFDFEGRAVRVVEDEAGLPWFVARDVCECLEIRNSRDAVAKLDDDEKGVGNADTLGGNQEVAVVNEPGVYRLAFTSRKEAARRFTRWVTHEVLPALRKTGSYSMAEPAIAHDLPTGPGPSFAADRVVGAARTFTSLQRAARAMGLSAARAVASANAATLRATGIDLAAELDIDISADPLPAPATDAGTQVVEVVRRYRRKGLTSSHVQNFSHALRKLPPTERDALINSLVAEGRLIQYIPPGRRAPFLYHPDFAPEVVTA